METLSKEVSLDGLVTTTHMEEDGKLSVSYEQNAEPAFEQVLQARNHGDVWHRGMKQNRVHALHIPTGVVMELFGVGVNVYTAELKEIVAGLHKVNRYQACDMTGKRIA